MRGFVLSLYQDNHTDYENNRHKFQNISWSPYDRITIHEVKNLKEFYEGQFQKNWIGIVQQMHLISEYPAAFNWVMDGNSVEKENCKGEQNKNKILIRTGKEESPYGFCAVISVRLQKKFANTRELRGRIYRAVEAEYNVAETEWSAFYSLGAEDMVFIVLTNRIPDIQSFLYILARAEANIDGKKEQLFSMVTSFANMNYAYWEGKPEAGLLLRLNLKSNDEAKVHAVEQKLEEEGIPKEAVQRLMLGRGALDVRIPAELVKMTWYFNEQCGFLNGASEFYKTYIDSSRSYWMKTNESFAGKIEIHIDKSWEEGEVSDDINGLLELCNGIPIAQFVIKEYQRLICSEKSGWWTHVLKQQFQVLQKFFHDYIENERLSPLYLLLKQLQNVLLHIRQSTASVMELPYLNYTYAGSYNDIMKMYYGIISDIFQIGYRMEHEEEGGIGQYDITFCVDFESTQNVHSSMYILSDKNEKDRFIVFHLPFGAFMDIEKSIPYLAHEAFHYIAPYNRRSRNQQLLHIWGQHLVDRILTRLLQRCNLEDSVKDELVKYFLENSAWVKTKCNKIYSQIKKLLPEYEHLIINDFTEESSSHAFRRVYEMLVKEFLDDLCKDYPDVVQWIYNESDNQESILDMETAVCRTLNDFIKSDSEYKKASRTMQTIAHAYREAFCDYNTACLFEMDAIEYLTLFYGLEIRENFPEKRKQIFQEYTSWPVILDNLAIRVGIVLDRLLGGRKLNEDGRVADCFKQEKIEAEEIGRIAGYLDQLDAVYRREERLYRMQYQDILSEIAHFWKDKKMPKKAKKTQKELQLIKSCGNEMDKLVELMSDIADKRITFKSELSNEGGKHQVSARLLSSYSAMETLPDDEGKIGKIENVGRFIETAYQISKDMIEKSGEAGQPCWYRGVCNRQFSLLPNLYRKYNDGGKDKIKRSVYAYQTQILKDAYYLTIKMSDLWTKQLQGIAEHTCCLQHYGMPTTLLDFSLDMLIALHFALTPDEECDRREIEKGNYIPKVVIFNPVLYNKAIRSLKAGKVLADEPYEQCSPVMFNISDKDMQDFFVYDMSAEYCIQSTKDFYKNTYVPNARMDLYPKPIIVQQTNSRVLAQNGIFMAYNLNALPMDSKEPFDYLDLCRIQDAYLCMFLNGNKRKEAAFLKEIYIDPAEAGRMRRELEMLGVNKARVYPELSEIFRAYGK